MHHIQFHLFDLQERFESSCVKIDSEAVIKRIWNKDHTVWHSDENHKKSILNRLGWLTSPDIMKKSLQEITDFVKGIRSAQFTHCVVLGMGGSSLCPDVSRITFGNTEGYPQLLVLDSTNPTSVLRIEKSIQLHSTLFVVASKSGGTLETNVFYQYFFDKVAKINTSPGSQFIAITDADTAMEGIAREKSFRKIFLNPSDIGGRYSALSFFGLVPMAIIGIDIQKILENALAVKEESQGSIELNLPGKTGIALGIGQLHGRDKLCFVLSKEIETFAYWIEQLVAESTGKEKKGILPIEGETYESPLQNYMLSNDRMYVICVLKQHMHRYEQMCKEFDHTRTPHILITIDSVYDLGGQYFFWEFATAVAASVMQINPFDEPNVKESKEITQRVIGEYIDKGTLPTPHEVSREEHGILYGEPKYSHSVKQSTFDATLMKHMSGKVGRDYIALLAYIDQTPENTKYLYQLRDLISKKTGLSVTVGFGPRYLHSTGQLHKGGASNGIFLIINANEPRDAVIPKESYSFGILRSAQAFGDYQALASKDFRILYLHFSVRAEEGLQDLISYFD